MLKFLIENPQAQEQIEKIKALLESLGLEFYDVSIVNQGKGKYVKINISIKIS